MPTEAKLSHRAFGILMVMRWESERALPVTIDEIVRRLPISREAAKDAIGELKEAGLIEWEVAAAYHAPEPETEEPS